MKKIVIAVLMVLVVVQSQSVGQTDREIRERNRHVRRQAIESAYAEALKERLNKFHARKISQPSTNRGSDLKPQDLQYDQDNMFWYLTSSDYEVVVEKQTGMLYRVTSLNPSPRDLLPPTSHGLLIYAQSKKSGAIGVANRVLNAEVTREDEASIQLRCEVGFNWRKAVFSPLSLQYTLTKDRLDIDVVIMGARDENESYEIGVLQRYRPEDWNHQVFVGSIDLQYDAISNARSTRYSGSVDDVTPGTLWEDFTSNSYPQLTLESDDRYFVFGYLDLNNYAIFQTNYLGEDYCPAMRISPRSIQSGKKYSFHLFYKVLPKNQSTYPDTLRWYLQNVYSSHPLSQGIVRLPEKMASKTLKSPGGISFAFPRFSIAGSFPDDLDPVLAADDVFHDQFEENSLRMNLNHIWFGAGRIHERHPEAGTEEAAKLKRNIEHLQERGFKVYLYFRQLYQMPDVFDDKPPYRDWIALGADGEPVPYDPGNPDNETFFGDFGNPEFVEWYIEDLKRSVEYYQPDGIAWDMAWSDNVFGPCVNGGLHHGILRVFHDVYEWLGESHPDMRVIANGSRGQPTQLYIDALLYEGSHAVESTADICKIFNTTLVSMGYAERYNHNDPEGAAAEHIQTTMRHLAYGASFGDRGYTMIEYDGPHQSAWNQRQANLLGTSSYLLDLEDMAAFSALTSNTPMVTNEHALQILPADSEVIGTVWADKTHVLAAVYNDGDAASQVTLKLDQAVLKEYGASFRQTNLEITVLGPNGQPLPKPSINTDITDTVFIIKSYLKEKCLLLIRSI